MESNDGEERTFDFVEWPSQHSLQSFSQLPDTSINYEGDWSPLPEVHSLRTRSDSTPQASISGHNPQQVELGFIEETEWIPEKAYDEEPPSCLHYTIEWKVTLNGKAVVKDTETDVVIALGGYWRRVLQGRLDQVVRRKFSGQRYVRHDDTVVVVSVTERSQRDFVKPFEEAKIDWGFVEKQLLDRGQFFQKGKKLRVSMSFNYVKADSQSSRRARRRGDKRGATSDTTRMLADRDQQIATEEEVSGEQAIWPEVYAFMRCPDRLCDRGPHCWIDPMAKKHYRIGAQLMRKLIEHVTKGGKLQTHDDIPKGIRDQLYAEERQRLERTRKETTTPLLGSHHMHFPHMPPGTSHERLQSDAVSEVGNSAHSTNVVKPQCLDIPGFRDDVLSEYTVWLQSKVRKLSLKSAFAKACDVAMKKGFDLEQIFEDQDPNVFIREDVPEGIAKRFCRAGDIIAWTNVCKASCT